MNFERGNKDYLATLNIGRITESLCIIGGINVATYKELSKKEIKNILSNLNDLGHSGIYFSYKNFGGMNLLECQQPFYSSYKYFYFDGEYYEIPGYMEFD
jgi:hypothetical protein